MVDANSAGEAEVDLFGNPSLPIRDRRGRPSFKKTPENQDFVAVRAAAGWSQKRIADEMGVDEKTLRKNFSRELLSGAVLVEGIALDVLLRRVRQGHIPSVRLLLERIETTAPRRGRGREEGEVEERPDSPAGDTTAKKVQRDAHAQDVPDDYGELYARVRRDN